jgi:hypothetical protein
MILVGGDPDRPSRSTISPARSLGDEVALVSRIGEERPEFANFRLLEPTPRFDAFAGDPKPFEGPDRTTENRGVPGSSPGLAIRNPAFQRDFLLFG